MMITLEIYQIALASVATIIVSWFSTSNPEAVSNALIPVTIIIIPVFNHFGMPFKILLNMFFKKY
jgi:hypothetical protein